MKKKYIIVLTLLLVWRSNEEATPLTGSQEGNKFVFTGGVNFPEFGNPTDCSKDANGRNPTNMVIIEEKCQEALGYIKCIHIPDTNILTIYPGNNHTLVPGSCINLIGDYVSSTYSVTSPLPEYNIWPMRFTADSSLTRLYIGAKNIINLPLYNPNKLPVTYSWTQLEGDTIPLNATAEEQTYEIGVLDNFLLQYDAKLRLRITIGGQSITEDRLFAIVSKPVCPFDGNKLVCTETVPFRLPCATCACIISPDSIHYVGTDPLCIHEGNKYTIYWSLDGSGEAGRAHFKITGGGIEYRRTMAALPKVEGIMITPNTSKNLDISIESKIEPKWYPYFVYSTSGVSATFSWTQLSGDPLPNFPSTAIDLTYPAGSLGLLTLQTYEIQLDVTIANSNGWVFTQTLVFDTVVTATGYQLGYKIAYIATTQFRLPRDSCGDIVKSSCLAALGTDPQCVTANSDTLNLYADVNDNTLEVDSCLDLLGGGIIATFALLAPFPDVSLLGPDSLVDAIMDSLTLEALPTNTQNLSPIFNWTQISGVDELIFTQGEAIQTFQPLSMRTGVYEIEMQMTMPNSFNYMKSQGHIWTIKSKLQKESQMGNIFKLFFTWPFNIDDQSVNDPLLCHKILDTNNITLLQPIECKHKGNILSVYASSSSTLVASNVFQLKALPDIFSETVSYTIPNNLPRIGISGCGTHYLREIINITGDPIYIDGFLPIYTFTQISGPMTLILNSSNMSQSLHENPLLTTGEYLLQLEMDLGESSLGYKDTKEETLRVEADIYDVEQHGGRFRIYLTYGVQINGGLENIPIPCEDLLDSSTHTLLEASRCEHKYEELTIYTGIDSTLVANDIITLKPQTHYHTTLTHTIIYNLPKLSSLSQSPSNPWESENIGNTLTTTNQDVSGLTLIYTWEVITGNPIPSLITAKGISVIFQSRELAAGDYNIRVYMEVIGTLYIVNKTLTIQVLTSFMEAAQQGNVIYIYMEAPIYINDTLAGLCGCNQIISALSMSTLGSSPECPHLNEMVKIYLKNDSSIIDELTLQHTYIKPPLLVTGLHPVPQLFLSLPNSPDNNHHFKTELVIIKAQITNTDTLKYELYWVQIGDSPSKIFFDNKLEIITIREGQLKAENYSVGLRVVFIDSPNDYELYQEINFTMASIPSVQILGGTLEMHYMYDLDLKAICTDNDQNNNRSSLTWEWEISHNEDFSDTAKLKGGAPITLSDYSNQNVSFKGGVLDFKDYYFRVRVKKWEFYTSTYTTWVKIFEKGPNLQLTVNNIKMKQNNREDFCIGADTWSFDESDVDIIWKRVLPPIAGTKIDNKRICISAKELRPGVEYEITCEARNIRPDTDRILETVEVREMSVNIAIAKSPYAGSVLSIPQTGFGFIDLFTFNAVDWFDLDTAGGTLLYSYQVLIPSPSQNNSFVSLNSFSSVPSITSTLPPGDPLYAHMIIIRTNAKNQYGMIVYKDIRLKVLPPPQIDNKLDFMDNYLFKDFDSKPLSEQLFRLSMATYFSSIDDDPNATQIHNVTTDPCGGCSGEGSCIAHACQCNDGFDGEFCEITQQKVDELIQANDKIMSKMETIIDTVDLQTLFEGEDGNILLSAIGGVTKTQSVNNSATNTKAKKLLKNITAFFESEWLRGSNLEASGVADTHIKVSIRTGSMIVDAIDNLVQGLKYERDKESIEIPNSNSYKAPEKVFTKSMEVKSILETTGALMLTGLNEGEEITLDTNSFLIQGGKSQGKDMNSKLLETPSNTLLFPSKGLRLEGKSANFQVVDWKFNPFTGQLQGSSLISNALTLNLYQDNDIRPKEINNLTEPMKIYFKIRKYAPKHYCTYFNYKTNNFSDNGISIYLTRLDEHGNGLVVCSSKHLSDYGILQDAPSEYMALMSKVDYSTITKYNEFKDYDYMASPIFWFVIIISIIFGLLFLFGVYNDRKAYRKEQQVNIAETKEIKEKELNMKEIEELSLGVPTKKLKLNEGDPLEECKEMKEKTTRILVIAEKEEANTLNTERVDIGNKKEIEIINIPSLPTHQVSNWENEENIKNEGKTPVSNILRLGEEREKSLNIEEKDWNMTERNLTRRKTLPFILSGDDATDSKSVKTEGKRHTKNIHLSSDNLNEEGENVPEISHSWSWISLGVKENVVHSQEEELEIVTDQNNFQFLDIPAMPDYAKYVEEMEMDSASPDYLLDDEIKYRMGELSISQSKITEEDKEPEIQDPVDTVIYIQREKLKNSPIKITEEDKELEIQDPVDNNENNERENNTKEESVGIVVLPPRRRTLAESNKPKKINYKSFCIEFAAICCVLHPYVNIFFILGDQTLNIRVLLLYVEVLFDLMLCGAFTDSQGEEAAEEANILVMIMFGMTSIVITLFFVLIVAAFFGEGGPPDGVLDDDDEIVDQRRYKKFLKKEKIKHIIGYIIAVFVICFCMTYINFQSAVFGTTVSYIWLFTWLFGFLFDIFIIQPVKCFIYYVCTRQYIIKFALDILSGGLNIPMAANNE